jgi:hypothetical protein
MLNYCNEQEILFKITNGKDVYTNIPDEKGVDMNHLMDRSHLYISDIIC